MSDSVADRTLELACTVGSVDNAVEALEDGADINARGCSPLFAAIFHRNPAVVRLLVERGADLAAFLLPSCSVDREDHAALTDLLMTFAPPDPKAIDPGLMGELDAVIREKGLGKPLLDGDWESLSHFPEKLERIGAPGLAACVEECLALLRPAKSFGDAALFEAVKAEKKRLAAITGRYLAVETEGVEALARAYLDGEGSEGPGLGEAARTVSAPSSQEDEASAQQDPGSGPGQAVAV